MPSRAMLHTGRTLFHIDREGQQIPQAHITLGECLRSAGYAAFGTGKWHNGRSAYARSFSDGDEIFFGGMGDHWNVPAYHFDPTGQYESKCPYIADPFYSNTTEYRDCDHIEAGKHSTTLFVEAAMRFTKEHKSGDPFFMYISLMAPHDPRTMPKRFLEMYDPENITLPQNFLAAHPIDTGALRVRDELLAAFPREPNEIKRHIAEYYAMISHLDHAFGQLIGTLQEEGKLDNTIIVFAGDNGLALGQHGLMGKQNLYDHSLRVPLIFTGPGIPEGEQRESPVYLLDIFPTLCDLIGTRIPVSVEGKSLVSCMSSPGVDVRTSLYLAYANSMRGVSKGDHKLIEYACGQTQLFNISKDPLEMESIADKPTSSGLLAQMRQNLVSLSQQWDDESHPKGQEFWKQRDDLKL
jgi:arylsulfatase A-like enzyme